MTSTALSCFLKNTVRLSAFRIPPPSMERGFAIRELRVQSDGHPIRILYAFDPVRSALLLIGGDKTGNDRWYVENVPKAEQIFEEHLKEIKLEDKS